MADRSVKVSLILQAQGYFSGMDQVAQKTARTGSEIDKLNQKRAAFTQLGASAIGFGSAAAVGVGMAVSKFAEFDQQMSYVQAATHETASNMNLLRDAALDAGARTVFSATEAAGAIEELAKAGVSTQDILSGGLDAALDLAAAGGLGVAEAAGIAATALKTFNLEGRDMSHVADLLAAGAGKAMGDVSQLSQALAQGGQVAKATGLSIEETTAGLSAFAAQGLLGSDAGTSFKSMLQRLTPQSDVARREMERLGISAYDASGNFIGLAEFAGNLEESLRTLTPEQRNAAMATIFGSDAVRAANVLYTEGEQGIRDWISAVDDTGYAAETARIRLDNLAGDVEALGGALDTALIQSGSGANDGLRSLVQIATGAVDVFSSLPEPVQQSALYFGIAAAAVGLVGGAALVATPRIAEFKAITSAAGFSMKGLSLAAAGVTLGLTAVIGILAAVATAQAEARAKAQAYADTLEKGTRRVTAATRDLAKENLATDRSFLWMNFGSAYDNAEKLGLAYEQVTDAATGNAAALREVSAVLEVATGGGDAAQRMADDLGISLLDLSQSAGTLDEALRGEADSLDEARHQAEQKERADRTAAAAAEEHESAVRELSGAAASASFDVDALADSIRGFGSVQLDVNAATRGFYASVDDLTASIAENGATLDVTTEAGRSNQAAVDDLAKSTLELAAATATQTGDQAAANGVIADGRQRLIDMLGAFGITGEAADAYADALGLIPKNVDTAVDLNGVEDAEATLNYLVRERRAVISVATSGAAWTPGVARPNFSGGMYERARPVAFAAGGFSSGFYAGGPIHKFAEKHLPWELYVSPDPAYREKNKDLVWEAGTRLGMWQPAPSYMAARSEGQQSRKTEIPVNVNAYGTDGQELAREIVAEFRRELTVSGALRRDGD